ncbi:DUF4062 domain-containing protein [Peredibacter sp. HCB2-198]|uniref:DUF4062 domain-containing protein n=1 Tax=Peredibacter sp. HCB2-198 TaxID=3383025 RepID=UPI0038B5B56D
MAKPSIFISSTFYDLKHIRTSLEKFIEELGYIPVLSEKGRIAYDPDIELDESCYKAASMADIFVLIVGGRYGSETSEVSIDNKSFYARYESITKKEFKSAFSNDIPCYILVEKNVYSEYETFKKNRKNETISYAHVDSINIFYLLDEIMEKRRNNPLFQFERHSDIEEWLKEQWAGLFKDLLSRRNENKKIQSLSERVNELSSVSSALQKYIELIVKNVSEDKNEAKILIEDENAKILDEKVKTELMKHNNFAILVDIHNISKDDAIEAFRLPTFDDFLNKLHSLNKDIKPDIARKSAKTNSEFLDELNHIRDVLKLPHFEVS